MLRKNVLTTVNQVVEIKMESEKFVKTLIKKGDNFIIERQPAHSVSLGFSLPESTTIESSAMSVTAKTVKPPKTSLKLITKEELWVAIQNLNQKNMTTEMFAILIAPKVKRSVDPVAHATWDIAHGYIRKLMGELKQDGFITWVKHENHFFCNIKSPKEVKP